MKKLLVVVDVQNDFVNGVLGSEVAKKTIPKIVNKINNWDGDICATRDTHYSDYLSTSEGKHLPVVHCIDGSEGWKIVDEVQSALDHRYETEIKKNGFNRIYILNKNTFGSFDVAKLCANYDYIEFIGFDTDICVISNILIAKNMNPEIEFTVDSSCCAGVTQESHEAALLVMKMCQIDIK